MISLGYAEKRMIEGTEHLNAEKVQRRLKNKIGVYHSHARDKERNYQHRNC